MSTTDIVVPRQLSSVLSGDTTLESCLNTATTQLSSWFAARSGMALFPEYTDHGPEHLNAVLRLTEFLIPAGDDGRPNSWSHITAKDAAVLVWSVILHDLGMHLTPEPFQTLINESTIPLVPAFDRISWMDAWTEFRYEARRWDDRKKKNVFGELADETTLFDRGSSIPDPDLWTAADRRLAGEFVRRHHPRIAHEIALKGWPGKDGASPIPPLIQSVGNDVELADLIGFVARSHGHNLRDTMPYIESKHFSLLETRGVHVTYLMAVLRVADCLHMHAERAPGERRQLQPLTSPLSQAEWDAHAAIYDIRLDTERDPESVAIDIGPRRLRNVRAFLRLADWTAALQREIDQSWAVLGEVYGRHPRLWHLWLNVRRVKTNLPQLAESSELPFAPVKVRFDTAGADLLKLLVRPLYGDKPEVGIRELLQNSVDAVRERAYAQRARELDWESLDSDDSSADIVVRIVRREDVKRDGNLPPSNWDAWIEVADRGIGMSLDTIRNYFLRVGASFRYSDAWKRLFFDGDSDDSTKPHIIRSGRFGIGALAAFLIGNEIEVSTRFALGNATDGWKFAAELETEEVEIGRFARDVGTTVRVRLDNKLLNDWHWRNGHPGGKWYCLNWPKIVHVNLEGERAESSHSLYGPNEQLPAHWHRISVDGFEDAQWTYTDAPSLTANGIVVGGHDAAGSWRRNSASSYYDPIFPFTLPNVSIFDPNGRLPLDLTRTGLTESHLPFIDDLAAEVVKDYLAFALIHGPDVPLRSGRAFPLYSRLTYPGFSTGRSHDAWYEGVKKSSGTVLPWISFEEGYIPADGQLLSAFGKTHILGIVRRVAARWVPSIDMTRVDAVIGFNSDADYETEDRVWPLSSNSFGAFGVEPLKHLTWRSGRALLGKQFADGVKAARTLSREIDQTSELNYGNMVLWTDCYESCDVSVLRDLASYEPLQRNAERAAILIEWEVACGKATPNPLQVAWLDIIGLRSIPYSASSRAGIIAECNSILGSYLDKWRSIPFSNVNDFRWQMSKFEDSSP